jgi:hypothetical protein
VQLLSLVILGLGFAAIYFNKPAGLHLSLFKCLTIFFFLRSLVDMIIKSIIITTTLFINTDKHFLSLHSWVGSLALLFTALNYLSGALNSANFPFPKLLWKNPYHVSFGQLSFVFLCLATALGLYNKVKYMKRDWGCVCEREGGRAPLLLFYFLFSRFGYLCFSLSLILSISLKIYICL